jgi:hypothetical protein
MFSGQLSQCAPPSRMPASFENSIKLIVCLLLRLLALVSASARASIFFYFWNRFMLSTLGLLFRPANCAHF